jgi:hypothetical protein
MMKRLLLLGLVALLGACAHLPGRQARAEADRRADLWNRAHLALYDSAFARADSLFTRLAADHGGSSEGREAIFYLGTVHLDPRNPAANIERAETAFLRYLDRNGDEVILHRRPEALTLLALVREITRQPEAPTPVSVPATPPAASIRELQEENDRLRRQIAQRDEQIRQQREELDRIRRALAPRAP